MAPGHWCCTTLDLQLWPRAPPWAVATERAGERVAPVALVALVDIVALVALLATGLSKWVK